MEGREVFKHAVINIAAVMDEAITKAGLTPMDIDWFVPHQANRRIWKAQPKGWGSRRADRDDPGPSWQHLCRLDSLGF